MASKQYYPTEEVTFFSDLTNVFIRSIFIIFLWYFFFSYYPLIMSFGLLGLVIIFVVMMIILPYTLTAVTLWFNIWAYKILSWQTNLPYMNYRSKCIFLQRKRFTFSCLAEQIAPYEKDKIERCHREELWKVCWPQRIPSILEAYDQVPDKRKQRLSTLLAAMKEYAAPAGPKMLVALNNTTLEPTTRIYAGLVLAVTKNEDGIEPLLNMLGNYETRTDKSIRAVISRYGETVIPHLINAIQDSEDDNMCGVLVDIMGRTEHPNIIPTIDNLLKNEATGEFTRLQAIYALQGLQSEEAYKVILDNFEKASEDEQSQIKGVFLSNKPISLPLLIEVLPDREISEDFYSKIGDVLAEVDAKSYDRIFTSIRESKGIETSQRLARILKENTPEEEEFQKIRDVLNKHTFDRDIL